ncbi:VWA domain-containing protein [Chryseolinea lacunae]|uniref:BatD family protein n=1 Tax=Chryseolinea lacunae TaxID=2801331 RepID=A0ABS1KKX0_9BACT|nr:VWA domain-containing protein [Chryseolinea lacunae]MBL0739888.1 BatD family protein [Chryseolinea lacunae]
MLNDIRFSILAWCFPIILCAQTKQLEKYPDPKVSFTLTTNRDTLMQGECTTVSLDLNVYHDNRAPVRFYDLPQQLFDLQTSGLAVSHCFQVDSRLQEVVGERKSIAGDSAMIYCIYRASYCPFKPQDVHFPALKLKLLQPKLGSPTIYGPSDTLTFKSDPVTINVNPLPAVATSLKSGEFNIVGDFSIDERLSENPKAGELVNYYVTLRGKGLLFPLTPPQLVVDGAVVRLRDIKDHNALRRGQLETDRIFTYALTFQQAGTYDLTDKININYFNPTTGKVGTLRSSKKIVVAKADAANKPKVVMPARDKTKFIAVDVSTSMSLEDYKPSRLVVVKSGLAKFLLRPNVCDLGMIVFAAKAWHLFPPDSEPCNNGKVLTDIDFIKGASGTAMGDAIWLAQNSFVPDSTQQKILVMIGDGDNTGGVMTPQLAAQMARRANIKIFTIGIGKQGAVPYGKDATGKVMLIENTFFDGDLKHIAQTTGGKYYHAKDAQHLSTILTEIFK